MENRQLMKSAVRATEEGTIIEVLVQPRASRSELAGAHEGRLKLRITAPPVEGEANRECIHFLARLLHAPKSSVVLLQGQKSRRKTFLIRQMSVEDVLRLLQ